MSPLFGPILAQVVTLAVSDRTEARYVRAFDTTYAEAGTYPRVGLNLGWRHVSLTLGYGPLLTVTPLKGDDRKLLVSENVGGSLAYRYGFQHNTLILAQTVGYSEVDVREQALSGPTGVPTVVNPGAVPGGMTTPPPVGSMTGAPGFQPAPGTAVPIGAQSRIPGGLTSTLASATTVGINNTISASFLVGGSVGYLITRTTTKNTDSTNPAFAVPGLYATHGPLAEGHANYRVSHYDVLTTTLVTQSVLSSDGNNAWLAVANQMWTHSLSLRTTTRFGAGMSITRNSQRSGLVFWSIYPTFNAGINHVVPAGRSSFAFAAVVSSSPVLDPIRAAVDPGFTLSATASWGWGRFSSGITAGSALTLNQNGDKGAFNAVYATFNNSYRLGAAFSINAGFRGYWQDVQGSSKDVPGSSNVPETLAGYVGVTFGANAPLARGL